MTDETKVYNILITKGEYDPINQYDFYKERINSQSDFLWNEYNTQDNELNDELFEEIDVIVLLYGLYHQNKEICDIANSIGCGIGAVLILIENPKQALIFVIMFLIIQQLEGNLIYPKVVGQSIGLPGIWVLTAITIGGGVLGVGGMLLAVPLFAAAYRLVREDLARRNPVEVVENIEKSMDEQYSSKEENEGK